MNDFLPKGYSVPSGPSNYMKFEQGQNKFRILSSPIIGMEGWKDKKPIRKHMKETFTASEVDDVTKIKHFWAMPVYNYKSEMVQILEITQKGIMKSLTALANDEAWGTPLNYDIVVTREGEGMDTEYQLIPSPPKEVSKEITEAYKATPINLSALFDGSDPFGKEITDSELDKIAEEI